MEWRTKFKNVCHHHTVGKKDIYIRKGYCSKVPKTLAEFKMKRPVQYAEARRILGKTSLTDGFWLCTNENLRSLYALSEALEKADNEVFRYHVTRDRNDFEAWIRETVKDKELAREIARVKTKETLIRKITERTEELKNVIKKHKRILEQLKKKQRKQAKDARRKRAAKKRKKTGKARRKTSSGRKRRR